MGYGTSQKWIEYGRSEESFEWFETWFYVHNTLVKINEEWLN